MSSKLSELNPFSFAQPKTKGERNVLLGLMIASGLVLLILVIYYYMNPRQIVGDQLVNNPNGTPFEIPSPSVFNFQMKPITIAFIVGVIFSYTLLTLSQDLVKKYVPRPVRQLILVLAVVVLAVQIYEIFYNFSLWSALMTSGANPNTLVNSHPNNNVQINLVFATKTTVLYAVIAFLVSLAFKNSLAS